MLKWHAETPFSLLLGLKLYTWINRRFTATIYQHWFFSLLPYLYVDMFNQKVKIYRSQAVHFVNGIYQDFIRSVLLHLSVFYFGFVDAWQDSESWGTFFAIYLDVKATVITFTGLFINYTAKNSVTTTLSLVQTFLSISIA